MATDNQAPQEKLREEILADARRQADRLLRRAGQEAAAITKQATREADQHRTQAIDLARKTADRKTALLLASIPIERGRMRAARIERLLDSVREGAAAQIKPPNPLPRETLLSLIAEAAAAMDGGDFLLRLSPADRQTLTETFIDEIRERAGKPQLIIRLAEPLAVQDSGPVLQDTQGHQFWDNRLASRLTRMWPLLRRRIAALTRLDAPDLTEEKPL